MAVCLGDFPANKLESNIRYTYRLNQLTVWCNAPQNETVKKAFSTIKTWRILCCATINQPLHSNGADGQRNLRSIVGHDPIRGGRISIFGSYCLRLLFHKTGSGDVIV